MKDNIAWFPKLEAHAHWLCLSRELDRLNAIIENDGLIEELRDSIGQGAESAVCAICTKLDEAESGWGADHVPIMVGQVTQLHRHKALGYLHASCGLRTLTVLERAGMPITGLGRQLRLSRVHWMRKRKQLMYLPHLTETIATYLGNHIKETMT